MKDARQINSRFEFTSEVLRLYFRSGVPDRKDREESLLCVLLLEDDFDEHESDDLRFRRLFLESQEDDDNDDDEYLRLRLLYLRIYKYGTEFQKNETF